MGLDSYDCAVLDDESYHLGLKTDFASATDDGVAHVFYDAREPVGADMRVGIDEDAGGGSVLTEHVEYLVGIAAFLAAGVEFAVGEGSCSSFSEGIVGFGIYGVFAGDEGYVLTAFVDVLASLDDDGTDSEFDESEGCKESAWSGSDDYGFGVSFYVLVVCVLVFVVGGFFSYICTYLEVDVYGALAGIDAALEYTYMVYGFCIDSFIGLQKSLYCLL